MYVGQSRTNTDANNASSLVSVLGTVNADETVYSALQGKADGDKVTYKWIKASTPSEGTYALQKAITAYMNTVLPDGLPESKTNLGFELVFTVKASGTTKSASVTCNVPTTATTAENTTAKGASTGG